MMLHYAALSMSGLIVGQVVHISWVIWITFCGSHQLTDSVKIKDGLPF